MFTVRKPSRRSYMSDKEYEAYCIRHRIRKIAGMFALGVSMVNDDPPMVFIKLDRPTVPSEEEYKTGKATNKHLETGRRKEVHNLFVQQGRIHRDWWSIRERDTQ
jgi:hypothetical protein